MVTKRRQSSQTKTSKGQRTQQVLRQSALALFAKNGFERTTLRQIATKAGVSLGLLYRYYPSKEALVIELYDELSQEFSARATPLPEGPWVLRFLHTLRLSIEVLSPHRDALRAMVPALLVAPSHPLFIPGGQPSHARVESRFVDVVCGASDAPVDAERQGRRLYLVHLLLVLGWLLDRSDRQSATLLALDLAGRWAPLGAALLSSPAMAKLLEPGGEALELAILGRRIE
jgi:AcrR family transcriptional regulator